MKGRIDMEDINKEKIINTLKRNLRIRFSWYKPNVLIIDGDKINFNLLIEEFAKDSGINLIRLNMKDLDLYEVSRSIYGKIHEDDKLAFPFLIRNLRKPNTILYLEDFNHVDVKIRNCFSSLIKDHRIQNEVFNNLLFTIATCNNLDEENNLGFYELQNFSIVHNCL